MYNIRESIFQNVFGSRCIAESHTRFIVANVLETVFVKFLLEIILIADGEGEFILERLCYFQNAVAPVVGSLGVLNVVNAKISDSQRLLELGSIVNGAMANKTMAVKSKFL